MAKYLSNIDLNKNELQNPVIHPLGTAPSTPTEGQVYYDSTSGDKHIYLYNGTAWVQLSEGTHTTDYVSNVSLSGTDLTFTGVGNAFNGTVDLSSLDEIVNNSLVSISAGGGLSGGGNFTLNQATNASITINIGAGDGIEVNQDDIAVLVDGTTIDFDGSGNVSAVTAAVVNNGTSLATGDQIYDFTVALPISTFTNDSNYISGNQTITLSGEVTGSGTTSISTTVANGVLDVANFNGSAIVIESEGIENNDNDTTIPTSAAVKDYVDSNVVGGLVYQGGYNAATNTPNLDSNPNPNPIKKGWTYTVTADGSFFTEQVRVGDVLIAENDAPTTLAEWTTVQNNIDLASLTQVGIGNVNAGDAIDVSYSSGTATVSVEDSTATNKGAIIVSAETNADLRGIYVNYDASGEVAVGLNIDGIPEDATPPMDESVMVYNDQQSGENYSIQISDLLALASGQTSYATTITNTATITHNLGTKDVIIQLYDVTTDETVYADVERASTNTATITFASTPTNSIRVLVQKIG